MPTCRYPALIAAVLLSSLSYASEYEENYLRGLTKSITQYIHNVNTQTSESNFNKVKDNFTAPSWRSLMRTLRMNGTNELLHKHRLQQTVAIDEPVRIQQIQQEPNAVWQATVRANVKFDNSAMRIQQSIVDDYIIRKIGTNYKIHGFSETITGEPTRVDKQVKHDNSCPLTKR